jgi:hypothetical protein
LNTKYLDPKLPKFYYQIFENWYKLYSTPPGDVKEIKLEQLWNNQFILIDNKPVLYKYWNEKGICLLGHIIHEDGRIMSKEELNNKYEIDVKYMDYLSLVSAIPKEWKLLLHGNLEDECVLNFIPYVQLGHKHALFKNMKCKEIYWHIVNSLVVTPTAVYKWQEEYPLPVTEWKDVFSLPFGVSRETKKQSFQYKILHQIFPCQDKLYQWNISDDNCCTSCGKIDTLIHYFYSCPVSERF